MYHNTKLDGLFKWGTYGFLYIFNRFRVQRVQITGRIHRQTNKSIPVIPCQVPLARGQRYLHAYRTRNPLNRLNYLHFYSRWPFSMTTSPSGLPKEQCPPRETAFQKVPLLVNIFTSEKEIEGDFLKFWRKINTISSKHNNNFLKLSISYFYQNIHAIKSLSVYFTLPFF